MAQPLGTIWEIHNSGLDTNGGSFDPSNTNMATNGAATNANTASPVFTSVTYTFAAGDVGHYLYIKSGTNWTPGWYAIASVSAGAATLTGACATVASPTSSTWTIDYSQLDAGIAFSSMTTAAANAILLSASFKVSHIGNTIQIASGTNFTTGFYSISSVSSGVSATVDRNCTTAAGSSGAGTVGGAMLSLGAVGAAINTAATAAHKVWVKGGAYSITTATANITAGGLKITTSSASGTRAAGTLDFRGYTTTRGDTCNGTSRPTFTYSNNASTIAFDLQTASLTMIRVENFIFDGGTTPASTGGVISASNSGNNRVNNCKVTHFAGTGIKGNAGDLVLNCEGTANTGGSFIGSQSTTFIGCSAHDNTTTNGHGFQAQNGNPARFIYCIASNCAGYGFSVTSSANSMHLINCTAYANARGGVLMESTVPCHCINTIAYGNTGYGFTLTTASPQHFIYNCAGGNNSTADFDTTLLRTSDSSAGLDQAVFGFVTLTADPFTAKGSNDYSLNNTAGGGAALRALGYPSSYSGLSTPSALDIGASQHPLGTIASSA